MHVEKMGLWRCGFIPLEARASYNIQQNKIKWANYKTTINKDKLSQESEHFEFHLDSILAVTILICSLCCFSE